MIRRSQPNFGVLDFRDQNWIFSDHCDLGCFETMLLTSATNFSTTATNFSLDATLVLSRD